MVVNKWEIDWKKETNRWDTEDRGLRIGIKGEIDWKKMIGNRSRR